MQGGLFDRLSLTIGSNCANCNVASTDGIKLAKVKLR